MTISTHTYPNGFRIIHEKPKNNINITCAYLFCDVGSVHEYDKMRGVSHFIEHMCFKGTEKIPNSVDIMTEYSKIGAYFNAFTEKRYTCYTIKCEDIYLQNSLDIVSDMMMNSVFNKKEFEKEHKVVIEENNNDENDAESIADDGVNRLLYKGSSYEEPVDNLSFHKKNNLKYGDVIDFYKKYYTQNNMVLSIVSHMPFDDIKSLLKKTYFLNKVNKHDFPIDKKVIQYALKPYADIQYKLIEKKSITNTIISIGFRTCGHDNKDKYKLDVLSKIMGDSLTGRLMTVLREENGLVYGANTETTFYETIGDFKFTTKTDKNKLLSYQGKNGVLPILINIIKTMAKEGVTEEEMKIAKGSMKGNLLMDLEDTSNQCQHNGKELILNNNKIVSCTKIYEKFIEKITKNDVNDVIKKYFVRENMSVCIVSELLPSLEVIKNVSNQF